MAVGVDDRMGEPGTDLLGVPLFACANALSSADVVGALCGHSRPSASNDFHMGTSHARAAPLSETKGDRATCPYRSSKQSKQGDGAHEHHWSGGKRLALSGKK